MTIIIKKVNLKEMKPKTKYGSGNTKGISWYCLMNPNLKYKMVTANSRVPSVGT